MHITTAVLVCLHLLGVLLLWFQPQTHTQAITDTPAPAVVSPPRLATLTLAPKKPVAKLSEAWPITVTLTSKTDMLTLCPPSEWSSRINWQVTQVGKGPVALAPVIEQHASTKPAIAMPLKAHKTATFTIDLHQYPLMQGVWQPGVYRVMAKLGLCQHGGDLTWVSSQNPVYLDIIP
jgi:hypothetical protein